MGGDPLIKIKERLNIKEETEPQKIDLHIHTNYSDGSLSPEEIIRWAAEKQLQTIAITDHDGMGGIEAGQRAGREKAIRVLPGIEISSETDFSFIGYGGRHILEGVGIHILGYSIDINNKKLAEACEMMNLWRKERNEKMIRVINEQGIDIKYSDLLRNKPEGFIGKPDIARALIAGGYIDKVYMAFQEGGIFSLKEIKKIKKKKIGSKGAVSLIKEAGGIPVLAHPGLIKHIGKRESEEFRQNFSLLLDRLVEQGIEGIECIYSMHSDSETDCFTEEATKRGLLVTKGSDYHGPGGGHGAEDC